MIVSLYTGADLWLMLLCGVIVGALGAEALRYAMGWRPPPYPPELPRVRVPPRCPRCGRWMGAGHSCG